MNCYWNMQTSGQDDSEVGTGLFTDGMVYPYAGQCYVNWDFDNVWHHDIWVLSTTVTLTCKSIPILTL